MENRNVGYYSESFAQQSTVAWMDGVEHMIDGKWDMIIAFVPCTKTSNAGARHLYKGGKLNIPRYYEGLCGKALFLAVWAADCEKVVIENPKPSKIFDYPEPTQAIQPFQFGHPFTKQTLLWERGVVPLVPTCIVHPERTWCPSSSYSGKHNTQILRQRDMRVGKLFYLLAGNRRQAAECWSIAKATVANAAVMGQLLRAAIARAVTRRWREVLKMKAWLVRECGEFCATVVFAETRGKAKSAALRTETCEGADFVNIEVRRLKEADKYYKPGKEELDWFNAADRIAMVKDCGFTCDSDAHYWENCADCPAKEFCDYFLSPEKKEE